MLTCAYCQKHACEKDDQAAAPLNCPSLSPTQEMIKSLYTADPIDLLLAQKAITMRKNAPYALTRVEETMAFAKACNYTKLGLAFCVGLAKEAAILAKVLTANGFTVDSIICKNGSYHEADMQLPGQSQVAICNPIGQAIFLNQAGTEFNILLGLCVGHDSLVIKHSEAPVTVLAAKDRVTGHQPLAALYLHDTYYKGRLYPVTNKSV